MSCNGTPRFCRDAVASPGEPPQGPQCLGVGLDSLSRSGTFRPWTRFCLQDCACCNGCARLRILSTVPGTVSFLVTDDLGSCLWQDQVSGRSSDLELPECVPVQAVSVGWLLSRWVGPHRFLRSPVGTLLATVSSPLKSTVGRCLDTTCFEVVSHASVGR